MRRPRSLPAALLAVAALLLCGCRQVVLDSDVTDEQLTYRCGLFRSQVDSNAERAVLVANYTDVLRHAEKHYHEADKQALRDAFEGGSTAELERVVVKYLCDHDLE